MQRQMTPSPTTKLCRTAVAIPVCNEAGHIADCLTALDAQVSAQADHIVLCINNTFDNTAAVARGVKLRAGTTLHIMEIELPPGHANAGTARRIAMDFAAARIGIDGVILTTDADAVVDDDWLAANLTALRNGADVVAGWVDLNAQDWSRIPLRLHEDDARECAYDNLCDTMHALLDPDVADPLPRHTQHSGASIAVTARMYAVAGCMPAISVGEDRAFLAALRNVDARVRHAPECHVTVSGRINGRATGGMADTIRRRLAVPDEYLDERLEPADACARRADMRRRLRACWSERSLIPAFATENGLDPNLVSRLIEAGSFGAAWAHIEHHSGILKRHRVAVADLPEQMERASEICRLLRGGNETVLQDILKVAA
jgi:hypothetical protein